MAFKSRARGRETWGRPIVNAPLLEDMTNIQVHLEDMETTWRRGHDTWDVSDRKKNLEKKMHSLNKKALKKK